MNTDKFLLLGNLSFGITGVLFWICYAFNPIGVPIIYPISLTIIQGIFVIIQYIKNNPKF